MSKGGLEKIQKALELCGYSALVLLSCRLTLDVENIHSVVPHKDRPCTMLDRARNFGNAATKGNVPLGGLLLYKSKVVVSGVRTCQVSVGHACHATFATCTCGTTAHEEHDELGTNVRCSCAVALFQTRDWDGALPSYLYQGEV